jgi:WD40 repeat protein
MEGDLLIYDIEAEKRIYKVKAHEKMINFVDGVGGQNVGYGAPEILTGGRDGCVRLWDPRQEAIVLSLEPEKGDDGLVPDCWAVGFGNSYNNSERVIAAGYDNGDVKLFDLKQNSLIWDTNLRNGVCGIEFDRKDIKMNKLVCTTLEGKVHVYDMRTHHIETGYAGLVEPLGKSTIWGVIFLFF